MDVLNEGDRTALRDFCDRVREALAGNLVELRLFGSKARGQGAPDSDLDVLVVVSGDRVAAEDRVLDIAFDVNVAHDVYISPRVVTRAILTDAMWKTTGFVRAVEREGVRL